MAGSACTPDKIKALFSSFIHSEVLQDINSRGSEEKANDHDGEVSGEVWSRPRDKNAFMQRVHTYSPLTWFAKPTWLSPLHCSRYGWENTDVDVLTCVTCRAYISGRMPHSYQPQVYEDCCEKLKDSLTNGHNKICPWASNPSPEFFSQIPVENQIDAISEFRSRVESLLPTGAGLPLQHASVLENMELREEDVSRLSSLLRAWSGCELTKEVTREVTQEVTRSAAVLSLCGWVHQNGSAAIIECSFCDREVGLWNFITIDNQDVESNHGDSGMEDSCHGDSDTEDNGKCDLINNEMKRDDRTIDSSHIEEPVPTSDIQGNNILENKSLDSESNGNTQEDITARVTTLPESDIENGNVQFQKHTENNKENGKSLEHLTDFPIKDGESKMVERESEIDKLDENHGTTGADKTEVIVPAAEVGSNKEDKTSRKDNIIGLEMSASKLEENSERTENVESEHLKEDIINKGEIKETKIEENDIKNNLNERNTEQLCENKTESTNSEEVADENPSPIEDMNSSEVQADNITDKIIDNQEECDEEVPKLQLEMELEKEEDIENGEINDKEEITNQGEGGKVKEEGETKESRKQKEDHIDKTPEIDHIQEQRDEEHCTEKDEEELEMQETGQGEKRKLEEDIHKKDVEREVVCEKPKRKKFRIQRRHFNPVQEHRSWCPWANSYTQKRKKLSGCDSQSDSSLKSCDQVDVAGWKKLLYVLLPEASPDRSIRYQARTTPPHENLRNIRRILGDWTSPKL